MILIEQDFFGNVQHGIVDGAVCFTCEAPFFMNPREPLFKAIVDL
jgi:hypothetical protein